VQPEQEALVLGERAVQRQGEPVALAPQPPFGEISHEGSVSGAFGQGAQISMPETPNTLLMTPASLMPALSSSLSLRLRSAARVPTNALRWRISSRSTRTSGGGTKLARTSPCRTRSAIHSASFTSVLRPGTLRMCEALPTIR
jgi:hypothetical protein